MLSLSIAIERINHIVLLDVQIEIQKTDNIKSGREKNTVLHTCYNALLTASKRRHLYPLRTRLHKYYSGEEDYSKQSSIKMM